MSFLEDDFGDRMPCQTSQIKIDFSSRKNHLPKSKDLYGDPHDQSYSATMMVGERGGWIGIYN